MLENKCMTGEEVVPGDIVFVRARLQEIRVGPKGTSTVLSILDANGAPVPAQPVVAPLAAVGKVVVADKTAPTPAE